MEEVLTNNSAQEKNTSGNEGIKTARKVLNTINLMNYVSKDVMMKMMPYVFFLLMLGLLYIGNSYRVDKEIRTMDAMNKELKELRSEYIASKSELMIKSRQSSVADRVKPLGLKESENPPHKIVDTPNKTPNTK